MGIEEYLRIDVLLAERDLQFARDLLLSGRIASEDAKIAYRAAFQRYVTALRRLSAAEPDGSASSPAEEVLSSVQ